MTLFDSVFFFLFFFFFVVVFLVFFRSFLVFEKISTIWPLLRSSGVSNFSQPLVLKKEIMIMTMKFHYFKNATFFSLLRDQYSLQAIWTRLTDTRQRVLMGFNTWPDDLSKPFLVVLIVTSGLLNLPQATGMNCNTKLTSKLWRYFGFFSQSIFLSSEWPLPHSLCYIC